MTERILEIISHHPEGVNTGTIISLLSSGDSVAGKSVYVILNRLTREGRIRKENGIYSMSSPMKPTFVAIPGKADRELFTLLRREMPFSRLCIWHTDSLIPLMHDIPNIRITLVGAEKDAVSPAMDRLENMTDRLVLRDTDGDILSRLAPGRDLVVVSTLISQSPTVTIGDVTSPTIEKILVDILCDNALYAMTGSESYAIYSTAFDRYSISRKALLRYAGRRNRKEAVETILNEIGR